jgi:hypothetical protein
MALFPETNTGLFVSFNSDSGAPARGEVYKAFLERYYPQPDPGTPKLLDGAAGRIAACSGWFVSTRLPRRTPARLTALTSTMSVAGEGPNRLVLRGMGLPAPLHFIETEPWVYRETHGQELLVFRPVAGGAPQLAFLSSNPASAFERVSGVWSPAFQLMIAGLASLGILISFLAYPAMALRTRYLGLAMDFRGSAAHLALWLASTAFVAAILGFAIYLQDPLEIVFGIPRALNVAQWACRLGSVASIMSASLAVILWARGVGSTGRRITYTLVVVCQVTFALWCTRWNLLG